MLGLTIPTGIFHAGVHFSLTLKCVHRISDSHWVKKGKKLWVLKSICGHILRKKNALSPFLVVNRKVKYVLAEKLIFWHLVDKEQIINAQNCYILCRTMSAKQVREVPWKDTLRWLTSSFPTAPILQTCVQKEQQAERVKLISLSSLCWNALKIAQHLEIKRFQ